MKDFFKITTIYGAMWTMMYLFNTCLKANKFNTCIFFILQTIVLIYLFKIFKLTTADVVIFFSLLTFLLILTAIDSNMIFKEHAELINNIKMAIPTQIIQAINYIAKPFLTVFLVLKNTVLMDYSLYIVPCYNVLVAYVSINTIKK